MIRRACLRGGPLLAACLLAGCSQPATPEPSPPPVVETGSRFNPADCGMITGRVSWSGPIPDVPSYRAPCVPRPENGLNLGKFTWPNQRVPDVKDGGLTSAVVFLEKVDPARSRPWDHPAVTVEIKEHQLKVCQGDSETQRYGFVQRGQSIDMMTRDTFFHAILARGAAFFSMPFADAGVPRGRRLDREGIVNLTSACGEFWMTGFLFVDDHPYYARTEPEGRFTLPQVPAGTYRLVCWHPDWREVSRELDGDTWEIASIEYRPALTVAQNVKVEAGKTVSVEIDFPSPVQHNPPPALGH